MVRYIEEPQVRVAPPKQDKQEVEEITETTSNSVHSNQRTLSSKLLQQKFSMHALEHLRDSWFPGLYQA